MSGEHSDILDTADTHHNHLVTVLVNDRPVNLLGHSETGAQIKVAAVEQGVEIGRDYLLEEVLKDGDYRPIEDHERVALHEQMKFVAHKHDQVVTISVNEQPVKLKGHSATGTQIKAAAIALGVAIQPNFMLQEELPNGTSRIIGDQDHVRLREHLRFTAITPDDNS